MDSTIKILVVDDDESLRRGYARTFSQAGYQVDEAATGLDALHLAQTQTPDLFLLDVMLPDLDGLEVCRRLKRAPTFTSAITIPFPRQTPYR